MYGNTPWMLSLTLCCNVWIYCMTLIDSGCDVNIQNQNGQTSLMMIVSYPYELIKNKEKKMLKM